MCNLKVTKACDNLIRELIFAVERKQVYVPQKQSLRTYLATISAKSVSDEKQ